MPLTNQYDFGKHTLYTCPYVPFPTTSINSNIPAGSWNENNDELIYLCTVHTTHRAIFHY